MILRHGFGPHLLLLRALAVCGLAAAAQAAPAQLQLVVNDRLLGALGGLLPPSAQVHPLSSVDREALVARLATGDSLIWIGDGASIPAELWVGQFRPGAGRLQTARVTEGPLDLNAFDFRAAALWSGFIRPPREMPFHNVDEEPRADLLPLVEARDRFGRAIGYPGFLMHYYAPSLVGRRFRGSECFFFLFDEPAAALSVEEWGRLIGTIARRFASRLQIVRVETDLAFYRPGECVRARVRVANLRPRAASAEIALAVREPGAADFRPLARLRRAPEAGEESEAIYDFTAGVRGGLWRIRVEVGQDARAAEDLALEGEPGIVDRREIGFVVGDGVRSRPIVAVNGPVISIDGEASFWAGTHYYPSSSWWEWVWRDFRPLKAAEDFAAMRRAGYRLVRVWADPALDEQVLRAMDAAVCLAAERGIVLDICLFTQWPRRMAYPGPSGEMVEFEFRGRREFNLYGISLRHLDHQREYARVLGRRWRGAGNVVFNLSNETYVRDPDETQTDPEVERWEGVPAERGILRDTLLFQGWAREVAGALRESGARQPVIPGYLFGTLGGGDNYLGNRGGEIASWHSYLAPEMTGLTLQYFDPVCEGQPLLLEELGRLGWNSAEHYEANAHYALAAGAAGALSYEWGVSWLAREQSFIPTPLREARESEPEARWFAPVVGLVKDWPARSAGYYPAPSGFGYGSIYHGTPFPADAARRLGRIGMIGRGLGRAAAAERTYVLIPRAFKGERTGLDQALDMLRRLWREKIVFGIWQEDCLDRLPAEARVLICPSGVSTAGEKSLERLRRRGVKVFIGAGEQWRTAGEVKRVTVAPGDGVDVLTRRTVGGMLYSLFAGTGSAGRVSLRLGSVVELGLDRYGLARETGAGVNLVAGTGEIRINGGRICGVGRGRAYIASADDLPLARSRRWRLLVTEPTRVELARRVRAVHVYEEGEGAPRVTLDAGQMKGDALEIDDQLLRYVLEVEFAD